MNRKIIGGLANVIILLFVVLLLSACKTTRKIIKEPLKEEGVDYLFDKLKSNELQFDYFNAKFNLDYIHDKKKTAFKGQIRIKKDSLIWISFSPVLGLEAARMLISNDSVKLINRLNKTFFAKDYQYLNDYLDTNIDYDILQAIIIGNDLSHYEDGKFRATIDNRLYKLSTAARSKLKKHIRKHELAPNVFFQHIWLNPDNFKITQLSLKEIKRENKKLQANYSKFVAIESQLVPKNVNFNLQAGSKIKVRIVYSKITIDKKLNFPFSVSKKYQQIIRLD
ncbi:MAG: DUF4292 domain-containing protein [Bacteroidetes bacterium]|nr:DUF4292 domain-containing protein [Bacteroidota bacterium]